MRKVTTYIIETVVSKPPAFTIDTFELKNNVTTIDTYTAEVDISIEEVKAVSIPLAEFYKKLKERATWTPQEVINKMPSYQKIDILRNLKKHGCLICNDRLAVFTNHPIKRKR